MAATYIERSHRVVSARHAMVDAMWNLMRVPFKAGGRDFSGVDCAGVIELAAYHAGLALLPLDPDSYNLANLQSVDVLACANQWGVHTGDYPRHGDLVLTWLLNPAEPCHGGIYDAETISLLHARPRGGVVASDFDKWKMRRTHVFRLHGYDCK